MLGDDPNAFSHLGSSSTSPAADIPKASTLQGLIEALDPVQGWEYEPEQSVDMRKARAHVGEGPYRIDAHVLSAFYVGAINEWGMEQPRVLVLSTTAYYRVKVEGGSVSVVRVPLEKLTRLAADGAVVVSTSSRDDHAVRPQVGKMRLQAAHALVVARARLAERKEITTTSTAAKEQSPKGPRDVNERV